MGAKLGTTKHKEQLNHESGIFVVLFFAFYCLLYHQLLGVLIQVNVNKTEHCKPIIPLYRTGNWATGTARTLPKVPAWSGSRVSSLSYHPAMAKADICLNMITS